MTKNMVSAWIQDLSARKGSPIKRKLTREWRRDELGQDQPITVSEVIPVHATVGESLAAVLTMGGPHDTTHLFGSYAFNLGIESGDIPLGASVSLFMFPILAVLAVLILRSVRRNVREGR